MTSNGRLSEWFELEITLATVCQVGQMYLRRQDLICETP